IALVPIFHDRALHRGLQAAFPADGNTARGTVQTRDLHTFFLEVEGMAPGPTPYIQYFSPGQLQGPSFHLGHLVKIPEEIGEGYAVLPPQGGMGHDVLGIAILPEIP